MASIINSSDLLIFVIFAAMIVKKPAQVSVAQVSVVAEGDSLKIRRLVWEQAWLSVRGKCQRLTPPLS